MPKAGKGKRKGKGGKYSKKTRHSGVGMKFRPKPRKELGLLFVRKNDDAEEV